MPLLLGPFLQDFVHHGVATALGAAARHPVRVDHVHDGFRDFRPQLCGVAVVIAAARKDGLVVVVGHVLVLYRCDVENPADARSTDGQTRALGREETLEWHGENWEPDWSGWLAAKGALRANRSARAAPPSSDGLGRRC